MSNKTIFREIAKINLDLEIDFPILSVHIYTSNVKNLEDSNSSIPSELSKFLVLDSYENLDTLNDYSLLIFKRRPVKLAVLGILSFLTKNPFETFIFKESSLISVDSVHNFHTDPYIIFNGKNYTEELKSILLFGSLKKNFLLFSILDRWRKALFLEKESIKSDLFFEESLLSYFHILELLSSQYDDELEEKIKNKTELFLSEILTNNFYIQDENLQRQVNEKKKMLNDIIISESIPIYSRICYFLDKHNILEDKIQILINKIIKQRNVIAHGKNSYYEQPLQSIMPFFPLIHNIENEIYNIRELTSIAIHHYFNIKLSKNRYRELLQHLPPTIKEVNEFINNEMYNSISFKEFYSGKINLITPNILWSYLLDGKLKFSQLENSLFNYIKNIKITKTNSLILFDCCLLLTDSKIPEISEKSRIIVKKCFEKKWVETSPILLLSQYQFKDYKLNWFKKNFC